MHPLDILEDVAFIGVAFSVRLMIDDCPGSFSQSFSSFLFLLIRWIVTSNFISQTSLTQHQKLLA